MRKKVRLLVVDEHQSFCDIVQEVVELASHVYDITCEVTDSGERARELVKNWDPSVVLIDAHITDVNSFELVRDISHTRAPIVVTSVERSQVIEEAARKWGASGYMWKSENAEDVERLVHELAEIAPEQTGFH